MIKIFLAMYDISKSTKITYIYYDPIKTNITISPFPLRDDLSLLHKIIHIYMKCESTLHRIIKMPLNDHLFWNVLLVVMVYINSYIKHKTVIIRLNLLWKIRILFFSKILSISYRIQRQERLRYGIWILTRKKAERTLLLVKGKSTYEGLEFPCNIRFLYRMLLKSCK